MFRSLFTRCRGCLKCMFVHTDNPDVVYCDCEGSRCPAQNEAEQEIIDKMLR